MKKTKGETLSIIGIVFVTLGLTVFDDHKILQYTAFGLGIFIGIFAAFKSDRERKDAKKNN